MYGSPSCSQYIGVLVQLGLKEIYRFRTCQAYWEDEFLFLIRRNRRQSNHFMKCRVIDFFIIMLHNTPGKSIYFLD